MFRRKSFNNPDIGPWMATTEWSHALNRFDSAFDVLDTYIHTYIHTYVHTYTQAQQCTCVTLLFASRKYVCSFFLSLFLLNSGCARWFIFKPKNPNLGTLWTELQLNMLVYFIAVWSILRPFGLF
jgi:hypothetical protein